MAVFPAPETGIVLTHFIVSEDVDRSRRFYVDVLGVAKTSSRTDPRLSPWPTAGSPPTRAVHPPKTSRR